MATVHRTKTKAGEVRYVVRYTDATGKDREAWKRTNDEAEDYANAVERDKRDGTYFDPRSGRVKLDVYFERWLDERLVKGKPLAASTVVGYRGIYERNIRGPLGGRELRTVRPDVVRSWLSDVTKAKGRSQAAKSYRLLHAIFRTAESDLVVKLSPCRIDGAGQEHPDERPLVDTAVALDLVDAVPDRYRAIVLLAAFAALRTGESLGLRRRHLDMIRGEVRIEVQDQQLAGHGRITVAPKSEAGKRTVPLPRMLVEALREHLDEFVGPEQDAYVFTSTRGYPLRRATLSTVWRAACRSVGVEPYDRDTNPLGLRMHDLRHHAATLAARKPGITTKELMTVIGHSSMVAALRYQHASEERTREVADFLDDVIANVERPKRAEVIDLGSKRRAAGQ